jgi:excisionase family DNA binding protein
LKAALLHSSVASEPSLTAVTEPFVATLLELLGPELKRLVREEVRVAVDDRLPAWLTVKQAAERIGVGPSAVRERIRQGTLSAQRWDGRLYVEVAAIDKAVADSEPAARVKSS